jgi:hypothetical protein
MDRRFWRERGDGDGAACARWWDRIIAILHVD